MRKIAIIPARYESSRFPGKPLIDLLGKTMIQRVYEGVANSLIFDKIIVATDSNSILENVKSFGGEAILTKNTHQNGTERCAEVIETFYDYEVVVNIQGDEPLVNAEQLKTLINAFYDENVEIATLGTHKISEKEIEDSNRIKIVTDKFSNALYFSRSVIPFERNAVGFLFLRHIGLYGFRLKILRELVKLPETLLEKTESLEQLRWLYHGYKIRVAETNIETPNIDIPEDVENVLEILRKKYL